MDLHEYQAKAFLEEFGIVLPRRVLAYTPREAEKAAVNLGAGTVVVKAQVHAGGRGKAGGVKIAQNPAEAHDAAKTILGKTLVTPQTGASGKLVSKVLVEAAVEIEKEFYLSFVVDRENACVSIVACVEGGTEIEEVAKRHPEKILRLPIKQETGLLGFHSRRLAAFFGLPGAQARAFGELLGRLYQAFCGLDCTLLEINPLVTTKQGAIIPLDAKVTIDDDALFRQPKAWEAIDYDEIDPRELQASQLRLSYVALEGNIGCMVNGAGLAMATLDMLKNAGGSPANFLDVGGGANKEKITQAFKLILADKEVKAVLVNIFGGIMRCDIIAEGIIAAASELSISVPLVVRLSGTNVEKGQELLDKSKLKIEFARNMQEATEKAVKAAGGSK